MDLQVECSPQKYTNVCIHYPRGMQAPAFLATLTIRYALISVIENENPTSRVHVPCFFIN